MANFVRVDPVKLAALLRDRNGPVVREQIRRGMRVRDRAKVIMGKDTHELEQTTVIRILDSAAGVIVAVGSDAKHALLHHDDTRPHVILPVKAKVLVFRIKGGGLVFAASVNHPGTKGTKYLERAAIAEGLKFRRL